MSSIKSTTIIQTPDKRLYTASVKIADFKKAKNIAAELINITKTVDRPWKLWLGMAAPQIGFNKRLILLRDSYQKYKVMVNPEIIEKKCSLPSIEKCYSLQGKGLYFLKRYFWLKIKYQNLKGTTFVENLLGPRAYTMQQEIDHINGRLISDIGKQLLLN